MFLYNILFSVISLCSIFFSNVNVFNTSLIDNYETNDSLENAADITPTDFYKENNISLSIDGNLDYDTNIQDVDYFYFTLFHTSKVTIDINQTNKSNYLIEFTVITYIHKSYDEDKGLLYRDLLT